MGCGEDGDRFDGGPRDTERPRRSNAGGMWRLSVLLVRLEPRPFRLVVRLDALTREPSRSA